MFGLFKKKQEVCLGIDLGASSVKIVELRRESGKIFLVNYVLAQTKINSPVNIAKLEAGELADLISKLMAQAGIKSKEAVISLPVGETFATIIDLPSMAEEELAQAIPFEARKYVPVPIEQVVLDWSIVGEINPVKEPEASKAVDSLPGATQGSSNGTSGQSQEIDEEGMPKAKTIQALIVAVPQEVIRKIADISKKINLQVLAVEQEAFSIARSLVDQTQEGCLIVDIGEESVDLIVFDGQAIRATNTLLKRTPEDFALEASKAVATYEKRYSRKINKIILTGGGVTQAEWIETLSQKIKIEIEIGNPFAKLVYEPKLEPALKEISPFMAVATGGAMREI